MTDPVPCSGARLESLRRALSARAVGWWVREGERLVRRDFVAAADLPAEVAERFAAATRSVALSQTSLGIVEAAIEGAVVVSRARDLPAEHGSGYWLRCFDADRSVAVPHPGPSGRVRVVVSAALAGGPPDDEAVARAIRAWTTSLPGPQGRAGAPDDGQDRSEFGSVTTLGAATDPRPAPGGPSADDGA